MAPRVALDPKSPASNEGCPPATLPQLFKEAVGEKKDMIALMVVSRRSLYACPSLYVPMLEHTHTIIKHYLDAHSERRCRHRVRRSTENLHTHIEVLILKPGVSLSTKNELNHYARSSARCLLSWARSCHQPYL